MSARATNGRPWLGLALLGCACAAPLDERSSPRTGARRPDGSATSPAALRSPADASRVAVGTSGRARPLAALSAVAGRSVEGREIPYTVVGRGERAILVLATIHGDEAAGTPLVEELVRRLRADGGRLEGRRLVAVPVANPDGLAGGTRGNSRGVDLNRNFPSGNHRPSSVHGEQPLSEPESRALSALVSVHRPAVVVSLHQPVACVDYDGPGAELADAMSRACGLPVRRLGSRPGSLGSHLGADLGIPIVTLELPRTADGLAPERLWELYGPALLAAVAWEGGAP